MAQGSCLDSTLHMHVPGEEEMKKNKPHFLILRTREGSVHYNCNYGLLVTASSQGRLRAVAFIPGNPLLKVEESCWVGSWPLVRTTP